MDQQLFGILAFVGAFTGILALIISIINFIRTSYDRIRSISRDSVESFKRHELDDRMYMKFNDLFNRRMANEKPHTVISHVTEPAPIQKPNNDVISSTDTCQPVKQNEPIAPEKVDETAPVSGENKVEDIQPGTEIKLETPITLYASLYKDKAFKRVSATPDEYTIYNITTSPSVPTSGIVTIDINAYERVGTTPEFLDEACIVSGNGSNVKVTKQGVVTKEGENWIVTEQIEVELN